MTVEEEVMRIQKKLGKMINSEGAVCFCFDFFVVPPFDFQIAIMPGNFSHLKDKIYYQN